MELGISSLGFLVDLAMSGKFKNLFNLFFDSTESCFKFAEENDNKICEIVLEPPEILTSEKKQEFIDLCNSFSNIKKQVHGPFLDVCLCSHNDFISKASVEAYVESAKICEEINARVLTIHPGLANSLVTSYHKYNKQRLVDAINDLLDLVKNMDIMICLENMPKMVNLFLKTPEIKEFLANLNRDEIFMTWDTSHSWTCDVDIEIFWKKFSKIIKNIHLVDNYDKEKDSHPALGTGKINFNEIFKIVDNYNYDGALIVELSSAKDLPQSIEFIQKFL
ncbi:MAG: sugar phosphate isomerase/epimerase [Promethearchaeota archaeon]|nr:MAG: sugar phosphate isomerase/epimerase [Candidatus Lokiarchaeota archaeon]